MEVWLPKEEEDRLRKLAREKYALAAETLIQDMIFSLLAGRLIWPPPPRPITTGRATVGRQNLTADAGAMRMEERE